MCHFSEVNERLQDAVVCYVGNREEMIETLRHFSYQKVDVPETFLQNSGRELNRTYWDKLVNKVVLRMGSKMFLPYPIRAGITVVRSVKYLWAGVSALAKGRIEVPVLGWNSYWSLSASQ